MVAVVVPTEDAIQALTEHLVYPLLPNRSSSMEAPKAHQQEAVAKQMHAVTLLYNYYHRKQFPELEFLAFESFCKVAVTAKPSLSVYMKFMRGCKDGSGDLDKQLSITERMIMDACNVCTSLDSSKDAPNMESWPISKVAVFLVDAMKQKCLLQFCMITQGVWSLVERDLDTPFDHLLDGTQVKKHASNGKKFCCGSSGDKSCGIEDILQQLALSAVNERTGIHQSNLNVLEHHITYSLRQEKTTTRLYIMTYKEAVNEEFVEIPIKDVLSSLRGPLFKRSLTVEVTPVIEYYHLLPYINILSDWLCRETTHDGPSHVMRPHTDVGGKYYLEPIPIIEDHYSNDKSDWNEQVPSFLSNEKNQTENEILNKKDHFFNDKSDWNEQVPSSLNNEKNQTENEIVNKKEDGPSLSGSVRRFRNITGGSFSDPDGLSTMGVQGQEMNDNSFSSVKTIDTLSDKNMMKSTVGHNKGISGSCTSGSTEAVSYKKDDNTSLNHQQQVSYQVDNIKRRKTAILEAHISKREMTSKQVDVSIAVDEIKDKVDNIKRRKTAIPDAHFSKREMMPKQVDVSVAVDEIKVKAAMVDSIEEPCKTESIAGEPLSKAVISDSVEDRTATCDLPLVPLQLTYENHDTFHLPPKAKKNDVLQAALRVLYKHRDELCQQHYLLEDEIARCEMNIQTILNGGEEKLPSNVELIIEACNDLCASQMRKGTSVCLDERSLTQRINRKRLSEAVLSLCSPCQELDNICRENSWILPRYSVLPSFADGMFQAKVTVQGMDFEFTGGGDLKSAPLEARESAASLMLNKLRSMAGQAQ